MTPAASAQPSAPEPALPALRALPLPPELVHLKKAGERQMYETADGRFLLIHAHISWWSGRGGKHGLGGTLHGQEWSAIDRSAPEGRSREVAKGHTLAKARLLLGRYLSDEQAGCCRHPARYGVQ